jgi:hypothetical protein
MFGLTPEVITLLGSTVIGGVLKIWGMKQQSQAARDKQLMDAYTAQTLATSAARNDVEQHEGLSWARKVVIIMVTFSVFLLPLIAAVCYNIPINYIYEETIKGGIFSHTRTVMTAIRVEGVAILPYMVQTMLSISGVLFGSWITGKLR